MVVGKTISIYLVDGIPNGILTSEIGNWTGKVIVAPRTQLLELSKREESKKIGVYFLIGEDPEDATENKVYVGESENILKRLLQHETNENKDFWTKTVLIISKDENFHKAHIRYLESRLIEIIKASGRAKLENGNEPVRAILPEAQISDMELFLSQLQFILPVLGFDFVQPRPIIKKPPQNGGGDIIDMTESPMFTLSMGGTCNANMKIVNNEFVVLKGSLACKQPKQGWTSYKPLREKLIQEKQLIETADGKCYEFTDDISFKSPSAASVVVYAGNSNGTMMWKTEKTGQTYKSWSEEQLKNAMDENGRFNKFSWVEGLVDKNSEHFKITYKENSDPVALIGKGNGTKFVVQFLINKDQPDNEEILRAVSRDIDYYLIEKRENNPWNYAKYHCSSSANAYSDVHWGYNEDCR